jgi:hypothetical protein
LSFVIHVWDLYLCAQHFNPPWMKPLWSPLYDVHKMRFTRLEEDLLQRDPGESRVLLRRAQSATTSGAATAAGRGEGRTLRRASETGPGPRGDNGGQWLHGTPAWFMILRLQQYTLYISLYRSWGLSESARWILISKPCTGVTEAISRCEMCRESCLVIIEW